MGAGQDALDANVTGETVTGMACVGKTSAAGGVPSAEQPARSGCATQGSWVSSGAAFGVVVVVLVVVTFVVLFTFVTVVVLEVLYVIAVSPMVVPVRTGVTVVALLVVSVLVEPSAFGMVWTFTTVSGLVTGGAVTATGEATGTTSAGCTSPDGLASISARIALYRIAAMTDDLDRLFCKSACNWDVPGAM